MDVRAKQIFEANPSINTVYKVKGQSIYFSTKQGADAHIENSDGDLTYESLGRKDFFPKENDADGLPDTSWKNDQIASWLDDCNVEYEMDDTKKILLARVAAWQESEFKLPVKDSGDDILKEYLTKSEIEFEEQASTDDLYKKVREHLNA